MSVDIYPYTLGTASTISHPYAVSLSSSASSSVSSVFSDAPSQASSTSSTTSEEWSSHPQPIEPGFAPITRVSTFPQHRQSTCRLESLPAVLPPLRDELVPAHQRQHPRRSATVSQRAPPQLVRHTERRVHYVEFFVDSATQMVEVIWPLSFQSNRCEGTNGSRVLPLRTFIQETLRRSRTSYSTLQVALYYLILIKSHVPKHDFTREQGQDNATYRALQCGRRMFLAALILASKYLQDRNFSAKAWSKMSGLTVCEINTNEMAFLAAVNWKLHITDSVWERWQDVVNRYTPKSPPSPGASMPNAWRAVMHDLTPELDVVASERWNLYSENNETMPLRKAYTLADPTTPEFKPPLPQYTRSPVGSIGSQESTPTPTRYQYQAPRFLEPKPDPPRLGPLPTPCLTPMVSVAGTPAAGTRRPSMSLAMAQVQGSSMARSCVDQFNPSIKTGLEAYHFPSRRPSLALSNASTTSLNSSPESMITDNSRSSRSSSISSVSSAGLAPNRPLLARLATCRNAGLPLPKCKEQVEYAPSEPMSSPDFEKIHINDVHVVESPMAQQAPVARRTSPENHRKRGASTTELPREMDLQQHVRHLLRREMTFDAATPKMVLPDRSVTQSRATASRAASFNGMDAGHLPGLVSERRLPVQKNFGSKRTCCGSEFMQQNFQYRQSIPGGI